MTLIDNGAAGQQETPADRPAAQSGLRGYLDGVFAVVGMELRQRLRSRGWYIMLGLWFLIIGIVTALTWWSWQVQRSSMEAWDPAGSAASPGPVIFEIVLAFVLLFALLVAPAFSANAINGDRAGGTLAILQVTLLRSGQIMWGKFLASWIAGVAFLLTSVPFLIFAIVQGGLGFGHIGIAMLMLAVEIAVVCAVGVGVSALASRPLFSIVVSYLLVAVLVFGTLIAFGLGAAISDGKVMANETRYATYYEYDAELEQDQEIRGEIPKDATDSNGEEYCYGPLREDSAARTERVAWLLGMNPFVLVADAIPYETPTEESHDMGGVFALISQGARAAQAGPEATYPCANGKLSPRHMEQDVPLWPLGLGLQLILAGAVVGLGWRALRTPAGKLPKGTRVA